MVLIPLLSLSIILGAGAVRAKEVAATPPMGWNSYDCYGYAVTEDEILANATFMAEKLKRFGWTYVVVDYVWSVPKGAPGFAPDQDSSIRPHLNIDSFGRLLPDPGRFPSSTDGVGFRSLADRVHNLGLEFGIHLMRGIPREAVAAKSPIEGSQFTADLAMDPNGFKCGWLNHMDALNMDNGAGQAYLDSIFRLYASWGVDFVKVDDLSVPYSAKEIEGYQKAINHCGRPMVLSLSPGPTELSNAGHVTQHANMWRLLGDLWDDWKMLDAAFDVAADWDTYRSPGHWPDLDMLPLGRLRVYGPSTGPANTPSRFTSDEAQTLMSLWMITKSPLMFGGDLTLSDPATIALLENKEGLVPLQNSDYWPTRLQKGPHDVWVSESKKSAVKYLALFNREDEPATITFDCEQIGGGTARVHDLWTKQTVDAPAGILSFLIAPHGCRYLRLDPR